MIVFHIVDPFLPLYRVLFWGMDVLSDLRRMLPLAALTLAMLE